MNHGRGSSCFRSHRLVPTVAYSRAFARGVGFELVLSVAFVVVKFVLSLAKVGAKSATQKEISTGKDNDLKDNVLKHWF
jgi:hypothetical protein